MSRLVVVLVAVVAPVLPGVASRFSQAAGPSPEKASPFEMIRWHGEVPEVRLRGAWWRVLAIDDHPHDAILARCRAEYGSDWAKRYCEDLVEVLTGMGHPPGERVTLRLQDPGTGRAREFRDVEMSRANRERIRRAGPRPGRSDPEPGEVRRVVRDHGRPRSEFEFLARRYWEADAASESSRLSAERAAEDLDQLEWHLENEYSYLTLNDVDHRRALDTIRAGLSGSKRAGIDRRDFHIQLRKLMALFGDGHSRVSGVAKVLPPGFLPAELVDTADGVVAIDPDRSGPIDATHPFLVAIDGISIERWLDAARPLVARGSPAFVRCGSLSYLPFVQYLRQELGRASTPRVELTLASAGGATTTVVRDIRRSPALHDPTIGDRWRRLDGDIGYLPIPSMSGDPALGAELRRAMQELGDTKGLIIDVRGNGGGSRDALRFLLPFFLPAGEDPFVVNVAAFRRPPGTLARRDGYLENRFLHPLTSSHWTEAERAALGRRFARFRPDWKLPKEGFSDWHFMVIRRDDAVSRYDRPVVVLMDEHCFSATDIFLGAFAELPQVTLMGAGSGGGSGRSQSIILAHSALTVRLSTMASFRPDGRRYDGRGIEPDVEVGRTVDDAIGRTDTGL
ncbi:MAG: hypothetical protein KDC38_02800, partial [Planctomycetes bacterium]|nr:hypothetical protein [Planctomycetota bacterium]